MNVVYSIENNATILELAPNLSMKMKIQPVSDVHLEFFSREEAHLGQIGIHPDADVIVLAGDIDKGEYSWRQAVDLSQRAGKAVVWIPGNHEAYRGDLAELMRLYKASRHDGVFALLDSTAVINGVRFVGGTLWTDFALYEGSVRMPEAEEAMGWVQSGLNDFRVVAYDGKLFTAQKSVELHRATRKHIQSELEKPFDGKTVVVTHHGPHIKSVHATYAPGQRVLDSTYELPGENRSWRLNPGFVSRLDSLVEQADCWIHGHVHNSFDYRVGKCRVVANPRGYPIARLANNQIRWENSEWNPLKLVEV
jgi:Icc-related predicted phosphoesterase